MAKAIAKAYNVALIEVLTGFKYIGEQIKFFEQSGAQLCLYGGELRLPGWNMRQRCLRGSYDAVRGCCILQTAGQDTVGCHGGYVRKYGYYKRGSCNDDLKGIDGAKEIQTMMTNFARTRRKSWAASKFLPYAITKQTCEWIS